MHTSKQICSDQSVKVTHFIQNAKMEKNYKSSITILTRETDFKTKIKQLQ